MKHLTVIIAVLAILGTLAACRKTQDTTLPNAFSLNGTMYGTPVATALTGGNGYQLLTLSNGNISDTTSPRVIFAVDSLVTPWTYQPYDSSSPSSYNNMLMAQVSYQDATHKTLTQLQGGTLTIHKTNPTNFVIDYALAYDTISLTGHFSGSIQGLE